MPWSKIEDEPLHRNIQAFNRVSAIDCRKSSTRSFRRKAKSIRLTAIERAVGNRYKRSIDGCSVCKWTPLPNKCTGEMILTTTTSVWRPVGTSMAMMVVSLWPPAALGAVLKLSLSNDLIAGDGHGRSQDIYQGSTSCLIFYCK